MSLVIVVAAAAVAGALTWQSYAQAGTSFVHHTLVLGKTLARTLRPALVHDDVWQAYEILLTPLERPGDAGRALIVLDARGQVFAASEPRHFAVLDDFSQAVGDPAIEAATGQRQGRAQAMLEGGDGRYLYLLTPVLAEDGTVLGRLVQRYDQALIALHFFDVAAGSIRSNPISATARCMAWGFG